MRFRILWIQSRKKVETLERVIKDYLESEPGQMLLEATEFDSECEKHYNALAVAVGMKKSENELKDRMKGVQNEK